MYTCMYIPSIQNSKQNNQFNKNYFGINII